MGSWLHTGLRAIRGPLASGMAGKAGPWSLTNLLVKPAEPAQVRAAMNLTPLRLAGAAFAAAGLAFLPAAASAQVTLTVTPSVAPNAFGSPSFNGWASNAVQALYTGQTSFGTAGTPTFYQGLASGAPINSNVNLATNFPAWQGSASPATTFGPAFANELGNRVHWGVSIISASSANTVTLAGLDFTLNSTDGQLFYTNDPFTGADVYSPNVMGVRYGANGVLGGGDDTFVTSGSATQAVNAIFYVGVGNAYEVLTSDPGATNQDRIDIAASQIGGQFSASYTIPIRDAAGNLLGTNATNAAVLNVVTVPEPGTVLGGLLLTGALGWHQRRRLSGLFGRAA